MNIFKAIFNGWIRPRMEYQAAQIAKTAEEIAIARGDETDAQPTEEKPPEGGA